MPPSWIPIVLVAASLGASRTALADPVRAAEQYRTAEDAFRHGAYRAAAETFEASFREAPHAVTMYNAGVSWESTDEVARAADAYAIALGMLDLPAAQKADASRRIAQLEKRLGRLGVTGPSSVRIAVAHVSESPLPADVHLAPGTFTLKATFPDGHVETREVTVTVGATIPVTFPPLAQPQVPPAPAATNADVVIEARPAATTHTAAWITLGVSAALAGTAVVLGVSTLKARNAFDATGDTSQSKHDDAVTLRTWTNVAWAASGVAATTGLVLLVLPSGSPAHTAAHAEVVAVPGGLMLLGRY